MWSVAGLGVSLISTLTFAPDSDRTPWQPIVLQPCLGDGPGCSRFSRWLGQFVLWLGEVGQS